MSRRFGLADNRGFTLVELMIVALMMGIVVVAINGLYESTQRTASTQEEVVELQQNLRVAMDQIARDIRMAGFMIPPQDISGNPIYPIATAGQNSLTIQTASALGRAARFNENPPVTVTVGNGASVDLDIDVASNDQAMLFKDDDFVRILRPPNQSNLFPGCTVQLRNDPSGTNLPLLLTNNSGANISDLSILPGDIVARITNNSNHPNTVIYLRENDLLRRRTDVLTAAVNTQTLADGLRASTDPNLDGLQFRYILDDGSEQTTVSGATLDSIKAVRVTLAGQATTSEGVTERALTSIIALRNR